MKIAGSLIGLTLLAVLALGLSGCGSSSGSGGGGQILASITITPGTLAIQVGSSQPFMASGTDTHGDPMTISPEWALATTAAALAPIGTIEVSGTSCTFTASAAGTGTLTATSGSTTSNSVTITVTTTPPPPTSEAKILFIHRSVGADLLDRGGVRSYISGHVSGLTFYDYDGNDNQLYGPADYEDTGTCYDLSGTEAEDYYNLWTSSDTGWSSARGQILAGNFQVIAFKSCFSASAIPDSDTLNNYKSWYLAIRGFFDTHPTIKFIVMSSPPLHRLETNASEAANARAFANWLKSSEYIGTEHPNVYCFDLFGQLAGADNFLKYEYEPTHVAPSDSHPNQQADQTVGPVFAQTLINVAAD